GSRRSRSSAGSGGRSPTGEARLALLEERGDAFGEVLALRRRGLQLRLQLELLLERRQRRTLEEPFRHPEAAGGACRPAGRGRRPVDRGDDRLLERAQREDVRVVVLAQVIRDRVAALPELGHVLADAEAAACAGDDDGPYVRSAGRAESRAERAVHGRIE